MAVLTILIIAFWALSVGFGIVSVVTFIKEKMVRKKMADQNYVDVVLFIAHKEEFLKWIRERSEEEEDE